MALLLTLAAPVQAWHSIYNKHTYYKPPSGVNWNRFKVFLSSARHANSRYRGECWNPGFEENVNGRQFAWHAATGDYYFEKQSSHPLRNFRASHYKVAVSKNTRDNGYANNRAASENWNSNFHVTIHTNATYGCSSSANYTLAMYRSGKAKSVNLASRILDHLNPVAPGGRNQWAAGHHELFTRAPWVAYLELAFHDRQSSQRWIHNKSRMSAWRLRWAVDDLKGYPR